jgi:phosphonopyruvate decarboxylase
MTPTQVTTTRTGLDSEVFLGTLRSNGITLLSGVPCSNFSSLIQLLEDDPTADYTPACNEGEAIALAAGVALAGGLGAVFMQNSGLGNAVNPLTSLAETLGTPLVAFISWRGEPGRPDEPQHRLMGRITPGLLDLMGIPWQLLPSEDAAAGLVVQQAVAQARERRGPVGIVVPAGTFAKPTRISPPVTDAASRAQVLATVMGQVTAQDIVVATTGYTARELERGWDRPENVYVVGSMGCASSVALGIAMQCRDRRVLVLDGDGAALMRLEAFATIGRTAPTNLVHLVLDNNRYESTGDQLSGADTVDFPAVALACGYRSAISTGVAGLTATLAGPVDLDGPRLVHVPIRSGAPADLGRPSRTPREQSQRFTQAVQR